MKYNLIHAEYLDSVAEGDPEVVREIVDIFIDQAEEIHLEMIALNGKGDYNSLGLLAHKAKASVAIMGMSELAALLKTFELEARAAKTPEKYNDYIARFRSDINSAILELEDLIDNMRRSEG